MAMPLIERIMEADREIRPAVPVSPLEPSARLSRALGCEVLLKNDHLLPTGSFKIRGATNKIRTLLAAGPVEGVITSSTGNHGQAVARAGALAGLKVTVYVTDAISPVKKEGMEALGARLVLVEGEPLDAELKARADSEALNIPYVAPYNDLDTVAGQGTLGVELARQAEGLDAVFICTGGGGLIGGVGTALRALSSATRIVGVWPENSTCLLDSIRAGEIVATPELPTLSDGSAGAIEPGSVTFPICRDVIGETLTVTEAEIASAMREIALGEKWMIEGAAGVAVAGLIKAAQAWRGKKVAVVLCGRNIALETFLKAVQA
jgi:threonine dehydratase